MVDAPGEWLGANGDITSMDGTKLMLSLVVLALVAMSVTTRWPAAVAVTAVYIIVATDAGGSFNTLGYALAISTIGAVWWLALRTDGCRVAHPATTLAWIVVMIGVNLAADNPYAALSLGYLLLVVAGIALLLFDPRFIAIVACTVAFQSITAIAVQSGPHEPFEPDQISAYGVVLGMTAVAMGAAWYSISRATRQLRHAG